MLPSKVKLLLATLSLQLFIATAAIADNLFNHFKSKLTQKWNPPTLSLSYKIQDSLLSPAENSSGSVGALKEKIEQLECELAQARKEAEEYKLLSEQILQRTVAFCESAQACNRSATADISAVVDNWTDLILDKAKNQMDTFMQDLKEGLQDMKTNMVGT